MATTFVSTTALIPADPEPVVDCGGLWPASLLRPGAFNLPSACQTSRCTSSPEAAWALSGLRVGEAGAIAYARRVSISTLRPHTFLSARSSLLLCVFLFSLVGCSSPSNSPPPSGPANPKVPAGAKSSGGMHGVIETDKGPIEIEFVPSDAPKAVENFRLLAEHGYYDNLTFHRIVRGFMIQGGDPSGDGTGGESAWGGTFEDEIKQDSALYRDGYRRGVLAMANAGPNTNGSQFFIMHQDYDLPPNYVIFARVTKGMEVVDALADTPTRLGADGGQSQPLTPPVIKKVTIRP